MARSVPSRPLHPDHTPTGFVPLEYEPRYYRDTAKDNISTLPQVFGELLTNCDEAFGDRESGTIEVDYQPAGQALMVRDDGCGMAGQVMRDRLGRVGVAPLEGTKRGYFGRGAREVFIAADGARVRSVVEVDGEHRYSEVVFRDGGMDLVVADEPVSAAVRKETGISGTGTRVDVNLRALLRIRSHALGFREVLAKLTDCVQLRVLLQDPAREVWLTYGSASRRRVRFYAPTDEILVPETQVEVAGLTGTLVVYRSDKPITVQAPDVQRHGILVRGERAAYQMHEGGATRGHPGMRHVYGEFRLDGIEGYQRVHPDELLTKVNRTGLNSEHPITIALNEVIDKHLAPHLGSLEPRPARKVSRDERRRQLKMIGGLNKVLKGLGTSGTGTDATTAVRAGSFAADGAARRGSAPSGSSDMTVEVGPRLWVEPRRLVMMPLGQREVSVWADARRLRPGQSVSVEVVGGGVTAKVMSPAALCPTTGQRGQLVAILMLEASGEEGRSEVRVTVGAEEAVVPVHVREERASGLITRVVSDDRDNESAAVTIDLLTGVARVFEGRPEFASLRSARRLKPDVASEDPVYAAMLASCVAEAAAAIHAKRATEMAMDDMPRAHREDAGLVMRTFDGLFQEALYQVRAAAIASYVGDASR